METYSISHSYARDLRELVKRQREREDAALARLEDFQGTENDLRLAAAIYDRAGENGKQAELLRLLAPEGSR